MDNYEQNRMEEEKYLEYTISFIRDQIEKGTEDTSFRLRNLISSGKEMWENTSHYADDFEKLTEVSQHLNEIVNKTAGYNNTLKQLEKYKAVLSSPYFGRFDFLEEKSEGEEKIYVGLHNVMDPKSFDVLVYDWRAPISSIFYRFEPGEAYYESPSGEVAGKVTLKRQYKIQNCELKYFFDCSIRIGDEILQEVLSRNTSDKMRNIVETIQKEQDLIIRDSDSELLIVQGVAGSGKTSIALHRIAFLLYIGMDSNIKSDNIITISPNNIFSKYISSVLPELGEENVTQVTYDDIVSDLLKGRLIHWNRSDLLESMILNQGRYGEDLRLASMKFKGSRDFIRILDRLLNYYEHHMIRFEDVYFGGRVIEKKEILKSIFLNNKINMPMAKRLKRIEKIIFDKIHPLQRERLQKIERAVQRGERPDFEVKSFSRLLSIKMSSALLKKVQRFTVVDYIDVYKLLFSDRKLFFRMAEGINLPEDMEEIICKTKKNLDEGICDFEDGAPLLYMKLRMEGSDAYSGIRQVVIDEAQDYYPAQYEAFSLLFKDARYTVLGDVNQSLEKTADKSLYDEVEEILNKKKSVKLFLNKSYRSSLEINAFNRRILDRELDLIPFDRHEEKPRIIHTDTVDSIDLGVVRDIEDFFAQGFESAAVICKTVEEAEKAYGRLKDMTDIQLISSNEDEIKKGALVIPSYLAKGLEFDAVIVYNASKDNYSSIFDRKLLYIACTRALHRLHIYHTGEKCEFI